MDKVNREIKVFISVGNAKQNFDRVFQEADKLLNLLIEQGYSIKVVAQHGACSKPIFSYGSSVTTFDFTSIDNFQNYVRESDLFISHCGVGSIITALENRKKPILLPRRSEFCEHIDNHQVELLNELLKRDLVVELESIFLNEADALDLSLFTLKAPVEFIPAELNFSSNDIIAVCSVGGHRVALEKKISYLSNTIYRYTDEGCEEVTNGMYNLFPSCANKAALPLRITQALYIIAKKPNAIIYTTGAGVGLAFTIAGWILFRKVYCQESLTRIEKPSKWFRVASFFATKTIVSPWARFFGDLRFDIRENNDKST